MAVNSLNRKKLDDKRKENGKKQAKGMGES